MEKTSRARGISSWLMLVIAVVLGEMFLKVRLQLDPLSLSMIFKYLVINPFLPKPVRVDSIAWKWTQTDTVLLTRCLDPLSGKNSSLLLGSYESTLLIMDPQKTEDENRNLVSFLTFSLFNNRPNVYKKKNLEVVLPHAINLTFDITAWVVEFFSWTLESNDVKKHIALTG